MKSCRQQVVERAFERLSTIPAVETADGGFKTPKFELNRRTPLVNDDGTDSNDIPFAGMFEGSEIRLHDFSGLHLYELTLFVQLAAKGEGAAAVEYVNTLRAEAIKALETDYTLGGLARWLELTDAGDFIGAETSAETEGAMLAFLVHYATKEGDPFTFE